MCLVHQLLGTNYKEAVLKLITSDDCGIDVVRNKIKMFAQKKVTLPPGRHKIVLLDEADRYSRVPGQGLGAEGKVSVCAADERDCGASAYAAVHASNP